MTRTEFIVRLRRFVRMFELEGEHDDDPKTLHDWMDYFTAWLP